MTKHTRHAVALVIALALAAWAAPAFADLDLTVVVDKTKTVDTDVTVDITKLQITRVVLIEEYDGEAAAMATLNVTNVGNTVDSCDVSCTRDTQGGEGPDPLDYGLELDAVLSSSVQGNSGIVGVNQDVGNMVNQANVLAFARTEGGSIQSDAEAEVDQLNAGNSSTQQEVIEGAVFDDPDHTASITDSITNNEGLVGVNQNAGNMNNQTNALALTIGEGNSMVLSEASLGQVNAGNVVLGIETVKTTSIADSVTNNTGVVQVNTTVGNHNNQGSAIAFGALTTTASIGVPGS
jgi:hypothetical protein